METCPNGDRGGCDFTINNPRTVTEASCITARYDAGIGNRQLEKSGVYERDNRTR